MVTRRLHASAPVRLGAIAVALTLASPGSAYWAPDHMSINQQVVKEGKPFRFTRGGHTITTVDEYLRFVYSLDGGDRVVRAVEFDRAIKGSGGDGDRPTDDPDASYTLNQWIIHGGLWEDGFVDMSEATRWGGYRAVNHFHNPIARVGDGGYHGFIDTVYGKTIPFLNLTRSGTSAWNWAMGGSNGNEKNHWGMPAAKEGFTQFFTEREIDKRGKGIGNAFRALGQVQHLIEDNTVPDHARDLPHPGDGFEEYMQGFQQNLFSQLRPVESWDLLPATTIESKGMRAFWDQDVYKGAPGTAQLGSGIGIAEITSANFFAWNDFRRYGVRYWFSRVPDEPRTEYLDVDNNVWLPFPQIDAKIDPMAPEPTYWSSTPVTFRANPATYGKTTFLPLQTPRHILDGAVWIRYAQPLMRLAHGYAQSLLTLALPAVDAELVPDPADPLKKAVLRVWNLGGDQRLGNGVTWHVKKVRITPVQAMAPQINPPGLTNALDPIEVTFADVDIKADGKPHDSESITLSPSQRYAILWASHLAVSIEADIGTDDPARLGFGVMIPNSYPVIDEQSATNADQVQVLDYSGTCNVACSPKWTLAKGGQWVHQLVEGEIRNRATTLDPLGKKGEAPLAQGQQDISHIAAVAVIAADEVRGIDQWRLPDGVKLTLTGNSLLTQPDPKKPIWIRAQAADREQAEPMATKFTIDLQLDKAANPMILPKTDLTAHNLFVVVWNTAGSMSVSKLALWQAPLSQSAPAIAAMGMCPTGGLSLALSSDTWSACVWSGPDNPDPNCMGNHTNSIGRSITVSAGWGGPISLDPATSSFYNTQFSVLKAVSLQGKAVPIVNGLPATCLDPGGLLTKGGGPCLLGYELIYTEANASGGNGPCGQPMNPMPNFVPDAHLTRDDSRVGQRITGALGQTIPPPNDIVLR